MISLFWVCCFYCLLWWFGCLCWLDWLLFVMIEASWLVWLCWVVVEIVFAFVFWCFSFVLLLDFGLVCYLIMEFGCLTLDFDFGFDIGLLDKLLGFGVCCFDLGLGLGLRCCGFRFNFVWFIVTCFDCVVVYCLFGWLVGGSVYLVVVLLCFSFWWFIGLVYFLVFVMVIDCLTYSVYYFGSFTFDMLRFVICGYASSCVLCVLSWFAWVGYFLCDMFS